MKDHLLPLLVGMAADGDNNFIRFIYRGEEGEIIIPGELGDSTETKSAETSLNWYVMRISRRLNEPHS